jgi:hypothetical protein
MIRILEAIDNDVNINVKNIINEIMIPLSNNVKVSYIDETDLPDMVSIEFIWEHEPGNEEYLGSWDIDLNKENIANYSNYLSDISAEIQAAYSFIENAD